MSKLSNFVQRIIGGKKEMPPKPSGYISFSEKSPFYRGQIGQFEYLNSYRSWVYAAVSKRSDEFAGIKLTLNKIVKKNGENEVEQIKDNPVLELLDRVNPFLSFPDLLKITQTYKDLAGNAYWWLVKSGDKIVEIWPYLRPDRMSVIPSATEFIEGYKYLVPDKGESITFKPDEIIHFKYPNPLDPYQGVSPMEACYLAYNTYMRSSEWNNRFFANNARADFVLSFPTGLTDIEAKQIRAQWESRHRGEGHEHRFAVISGDAKVQNIGLSSKEMEFIEQMRFTRDEILAIFKVPKALLDPQELNYASARVAKEVFLNEVIVPLMKDFVQTLNEFLLPNYGDDSLFFDFEHPGEQDPEQRNAWIQTRVAAGAIAPNEIRALDNLPPFEGGYNVYMPMTQIPVGEEVETNQGKMLIGKIDKVVMPRKYNVPVKSKSTTAELRDQIAKTIEKDLKLKLKKEKITPKEKPVKSEKELRGEAFWYAKIIKTTKDEVEMRNKLNKEFRRQEQIVLKSLHEKEFDYVFDSELEDGIFVKVFEPYIGTIIKKYGEDALNMVDMSGFDMTERIKSWLRKNVNSFSTEINNTTQSKISAALAKAVEEGEGIGEASRRVKAVFDEATTSRARMIARTEISHASNYASVEAWKQSDVVESKEWFAALDERICEECLDLHGKTIGLDKGFGNNDDIFENAPEPPAHVNCRCTLLPVLKTKSQVLIEAKNEIKNEIKKEVEGVVADGKKEIDHVRQIKEKLNKIVEDEQ